jgi:CubicO group peptidase (beta-lactamase class C family)
MDRVVDALAALPTTTFLASKGDEILLDYGDSSVPTYMASVRKSVLSILFGRSVEEGRIALDATLAELGIDDVGGLSADERRATVGDLLTSRSGVYHPPATSTGLEENAPPRGSQPPGSHFYYNNWDFNALGTIFERCSGRTVFGAFAEDLAEPLGLRDYDPSRQRLLGRADRSEHLARHFFLSGRDLLTVGQMMVQRGRWGDRQVVPRAWIEQSTSVQVDRGAGSALDYGYLWWLPRGMPPGSFLAMGNFGQYLLGVPPGLVVAHLRAVPDEEVVARSQSLAPELASDSVTPKQFMGLVRAVMSATRLAGSA